MLNLEMLPMGDLPTWIGAVTTSLALIAASIVVFIEMRRDKDARTQRERVEQADMIAVWPVEEPKIALLVRNGSSLPIYGCAVTFAPALVNFWPWHDGRRTVSISDGRVLPPGDHEWPWPSDIFEQTEDGIIVRDYRHICAVGVRFQDVGGRNWHRDPDGHLELMWRVRSRRERERALRKRGRR